MSKALVLAALVSLPSLASTSKVVAGHCTVEREVVRLHDVDANMHFGLFAEGDSSERVHIQITGYEDYAVTVWGGVSGAYFRFPKKPVGVSNLIRFSPTVTSRFGPRRVRCDLVVMER